MGKFKGSADDTLILVEMVRFVLYSIEKIVGEEHYQHFLLFTQYFQRFLHYDCELFTRWQNFRLVQIETICRPQPKCLNGKTCPWYKYFYFIHNVFEKLDFLGALSKIQGLFGKWSIIVFTFPQLWPCCDRVWYWIVLLINCMTAAIFNIISIISQWPVHLSRLSLNSFYQYTTQYCFQATGCLAT